jgi:hypothetical protein
VITVVYGLCAATAVACAIFLLVGWRRSRSRMLFWSGLCFALFALSNIVVVIDHLIGPGLALWPVRQGISLLAISVLLYGLILEEH